MSNIPKVSIIVPIYNVEQYLARCMNSLLNQTLSDIEIIMVDDESPDNCPAMCDEYARQDSRVKVIHKKNEGLGFARNSGLEIASGEYVAFVDSDDFVENEMYKELYNEANSKKLEAVFCNYYFYKKKGNTKVINDVLKNEYCVNSEEIFNFILNMIGSEPTSKEDRKYTMSVWHGIYSNSIIQQYKVLFPSERQIISEDIIFHINFLYHTKKIGYINTNYYYYCENGLSLSKSYRPDRFEKYKILHREIINLLASLYPNKNKDVILSANRLLLGYVRNMCLNYKNSTNEIKFILDDPYLKNIIIQYPYNKLPIKYSFFIILMKFRQANLIYWLGRYN